MLNNKVIDLTIGYVSDWIGENADEFVHKVLKKPYADIQFFKDLSILYGESYDNMARAIQELHDMGFKISKPVLIWAYQTLRT